MTGAEITYVVIVMSIMSIVFWIASKSTYQDSLNKLSDVYPAKDPWTGTLQPSSCVIGYVEISKPWYKVGINDKGIYIERLKDPLEVMKIVANPAFIPWNSIVRCNTQKAGLFVDVTYFVLEGDLSVCLQSSAIRGAEQFRPELRNL